MNFREKAWYWHLTLGFAGDNYTTLGETLYYPKGQFPSQEVIAHEMFHVKQQQEVGIIKYLFLYLFCFPFLWNPWRYKWEYEAYKLGSKWPESMIKKELSSSDYGWLKNAG